MITLDPRVAAACSTPVPPGLEVTPGLRVLLPRLGRATAPLLGWTVHTPDHWQGVAVVPDGWGSATPYPIADLRLVLDHRPTCMVVGHWLWPRTEDGHNRVALGRFLGPSMRGEDAIKPATVAMLARSYQLPSDAAAPVERAAS